MNLLPYTSIDVPNLHIGRASSSLPGYPSALGGNQCVVISMFAEDTMYNAQIAFGFGANGIVQRRRYNSAWTAWTSI